MFAKKSLGQNFLKSKQALTDMITAANLTAQDIVLEAGPGKGVLTERLLDITEKVIVVEKDDRLIEALQEKFAPHIENGKLEIIHGDILELDPVTLPKNYKIVANIPYYITGQFLRMFLTASNYPQTMVLMLQKEVAKRIVARDEKESILSLSVKVYGIPKYIATVQAKYFSPAPKVDSAILVINQISKDFFKTTKISEEAFFTAIKAGFAHKRKKLLKNLGDVYDLEKLKQAFIICKISEDARAEDITLENWKSLLVRITQEK